MSWQVFRSGKTKKKDVVKFERHLEDNLFALHNELVTGQYRHGGYERFSVYDTKRREIHKASVTDRLVHQVIYDCLALVFEPSSITDSYSSRPGKGSHRAVKTLRYFMNLAGGSCGCVFALRCDIRQYFKNIDHQILLKLIGRKISDPRTFTLIKEIVASFKSEPAATRGMPLGNVTSQIFANIYLHELDIFIKQKLGVRFYLRYNDDFVLLDESEARLVETLTRVRDFLAIKLKLEVPAEKTELRKISQGIDFLGYRVAPDFVLLRKNTKAKVLARLSERNVNSYLGLLAHADAFTFRQKVLADFFLSRAGSLG